MNEGITNTHNPNHPNHARCGITNVITHDHNHHHHHVDLAPLKNKEIKTVANLKLMDDLLILKKMIKHK